MSAGHTRKSEMAWWVGTPLMVLLLYVTTWPLIEIKATQVTYFTSSSPAGGSAFITQIVRPAWLDVYWPLQKLRDSGGEQGLCGRYWAWWQKLLA